MILVLAAALAVLPRLFAPGMSTEGFEKVPPPDIEMKRSVASATTVPWIDANGWRFERGLKKALYAELPAGCGALAAAEAFAYGVEAILAPAREDMAAVRRMLDFLARVRRPPLPPRANVGVIDDGSNEIGEVLNLMSRRNLLYRVVRKADPSLDLNVQVGSRQFPRSAVEDPNDFAARVREKIGDDKRLVRLFGSYTVIARLTGDERTARLFLLNYSRRPAQEVRVRVRGRYTSATLHEAHDPDQRVTDVLVEPGAIEFTAPSITTLAVIDLETKK